MGRDERDLHVYMKEREYESRTFLERKVPAIIRLDGKAFHTFTKGLEKPFDKAMVKCMQKTTKYLCENIQGCVFGYTQSDEITLVLTDYATPTTDAWFGYNVQKMTSISASMATLAFNKFFEEEYCDTYDKAVDFGLDDHVEMSEYEFDRVQILRSKQMKAMFDSRVFSLKKKEVADCILWRQSDAIRNSVEAVGQSVFSPSKLHGVCMSDLKKLLKEEKGIDWDSDYPVYLQRGTAFYKYEYEGTGYNPITKEEVPTIRHGWFMDLNMPIINGENKTYVESRL